MARFVLVTVLFSASRARRGCLHRWGHLRPPSSVPQCSIMERSEIDFPRRRRTARPIQWGAPWSSCRTARADGFEANYTVGLVRGLLANGLAPHVVTSDVDHARVAALGVPCTNLRGDVSSGRAWPAKLANLLRYYLRLTWLIARRRPAVVHFTGIFRDELLWFEAPFLSLLFRFFAGRYVYTVHNLLPHGRTDKRYSALPIGLSSAVCPMS